MFRVDASQLKLFLIFTSGVRESSSFDIRFGEQNPPLMVTEICLGLL